MARRSASWKQTGRSGSSRGGDYRRRPSTASSRADSARARNGFVRKSSAPSSNTRTSLSSSPFAVSTITGMSAVAGGERRDRERGVEGKRGDLGGGRIIKKKKKRALGVRMHQRGNLVIRSMEVKYAERKLGPRGR